VKYIRKRRLILIGYLLMIIQNFLLGPSALLGLPQNKLLIQLGMVLVGVSQSLAFVPTLGEMIDILTHINRYDP
jgi:hypothetical protein